MVWRPDEHESLTGASWDERFAREAIATIVADAEAAERDGFWPGHPLDGVGETGLHVVAYAVGASGVGSASGAAR